MSNYKFAELPSNESVASVTTFLISAWFLMAAGAILVEPSVEDQAKALASRTPVVTVRQLNAQADIPDARFQIEVVAKRDAGRVS